ncbi:two-component system chemotaxis sensor kinase CheA [Azospirillum agricola]|uniref:chemotaxis protein CheA n=1 Tax=Azospirillum agricola TaxID=1720247 RepID=UPI001AE50C02|nr:chemotaxis protein CheA [Azospirillum agricola]MBP2228534.1 two-component system chemotaxis sensor kinase CheA [Azospirillum agricola]
MSALFDQFILESRDLLTEAGDSLLALERDPADRAAVDALFRAFHTLKGATGLFDLAPFTRLVHAGEDALAAVRDGRRVLTPELADRLFRALDQSARWIDALEAAGTLPDDATEAARRLGAALGDDPGDDPGVGPGGDPGAGPAPGFEWVETLDGSRREAAGLTGGQTLTALAYDPDPECFFNGDDPLALCRRIPDLRLLLVEPAEPLPPLGALDPYRCLLRFRALSGASVAEVTAVFRTVPDQVRVAPVTPPPPAPGPEGAGSLADAMLRAQERILDLPGEPEEREARRAAVARSAGNILAAQGVTVDRAALLAACADAGSLRRFVETARAPAAGGGTPPTVGRRALRVDPERLDRLMTLVGELTVAKSQLPPLVRQAGDDALGQGLKAVSAQFDALVGELQHAALRLRLLPLSRVFEPLPRLVRDTARRLGKTVALELDGGETEADRDILDALGEPLLHLVRNSLDHGIESPDRRAAAGKPDSGTIRVRAFQEKDGVVVEVVDDGAGIDPAAMRAAACRKGLLDEAAAAALDDGEAVRLVFAPGFSTAAGVSELSGRGVGMDAVRAAVERAGGRVEIASTPGAGTRVRLALPLTLSITRVVVVEAAGELFGVPVALVEGMRRVPRADIRALKTAESVVLGGRVVPLLRLRRLLGFPEDPRGRAAERVLVAGLGGAGGTVALVVDDVRERADVMLRPMHGVLRGLRGYSGTAVLGDGRLLLVLDLRELL